MKKGLFWIVFGAVTTTSLVFWALFQPSEPEWCNERLNAGACELYEEDKLCYCINEDSTYVEEGQLNDVYEHSQARCQKSNGSLAVTDNHDLLVWLSKRLYFMGIDNAFVALCKHGSKWFWMQKDGSQVGANDLSWRPGVTQNPFHNHATINVQTIYKMGKELINEEYGEYEYKSYNYDYYTDFDKNYVWYGYASSDNTADYTRGAHFICQYTFDPLRKLETNHDSTPLTIKTEQTMVEQCFCAPKKQIFLSGLEEIETFTSPRYPNNYCSDANCKWNVSTIEGLVVKLEWIVFSLEKEMDYVDIYDGGDTLSPMIGTCTSSFCSQQTSSSSVMLVHFHADHVTTELGFKARVTAVQKDECHCSVSSIAKLVNLGDTFSFHSPKFPTPYCVSHDCSWTVIGPADLGLQVIWYQFDLEPQSDFVHIHDGMVKKESCTGADCSDVTTASQKLHLHFTSDPHVSRHAGFSAVVKVVQNYCDREQLTLPSIGSISYSNIRDDGFIHIYESVVLTCPPRHKITNTYDAITDVAHCIGSHQWSKTKFGICVPVCEISFSTFRISDKIRTIYACNHRGQHLIPSGEQIVQKIRHLSNNRWIAGSSTFTCNQSNWDEGSPVCHRRMEVTLIIGGEMLADETDVGRPSNEIMIYLPDSRPEIKRLKSRIEGNSYSHASGVLPDGQILVVSESVSHTQIFNLNTDQKTKAAPLRIQRIAAAAASVAGKVFVCGGQPTVGDSDVTNSCEMFVHGNWSYVASMATARGTHAMVVLGKDIFAIGGLGLNHTFKECLSSVERYSLHNDSWQFVAPMWLARAWLSATNFENKILACGGTASTEIFSPTGPVFSSCESFDRSKNHWKQLANMDMFTGRYGFGLVPYGRRMFAIGGWVEKEHRMIVESYPQSASPEVDLFGNSVPYTYPTAGNESDFVWQLESYLREIGQYFTTVTAEFEVTHEACLIVELETWCFDYGDGVMMGY